MRHATNFQDINLNIVGKQEVLAAIHEASASSPIRIATVNPEFMVEARKNAAFRNCLEWMDFCTIDGSGVYFMLKVWARIAGINSRFELYHGADLVDDLLAKYADGSKRFYLLGGPPGLAERSAAILAKRNPGAVFCGYDDGGKVDPHTIQVAESVLDKIKAARPDILLVGFGSPKQELWIRKASESLSVPVMMGVGGAFAFHVDKQRAPGWMRRAHLEWLFRAVTERGHWRRLWNAVVVFSFQSIVWIAANSRLRGKLSK